MKSRVAVSLVELLVVLTIIAILTALIFPIAVRAKNRAKEAHCFSNLKQLHVAITMYRSEHDGDGNYGDPDLMGLPSPFSNVWQMYSLSREIVFCKGNPNPPIPGNAVYTQLYPPPHNPMWEPYVIKHKENTILIVDPNHDDSNASLYARFATHRAIGLFLGGHVRIKKKLGDPLTLEWWAED